MGESNMHNQLIATAAKLRELSRMCRQQIKDNIAGGWSTNTNEMLKKMSFNLENEADALETLSLSISNSNIFKNNFFCDSEE